MITFNKKTDNPFAGLNNCLSIFQNHIIDNTLLTNAYNEVKEDKTKKELFYSLLFAIGDVTNRNHNIFKHQNVDNGGQGDRDNFFIIMNWMIDNDYNQFIKFLNAGLFNEYTCFDNLFKNRVQTMNGTWAVKKVYSMFSNKQYCEDLSDYLVTIIKGNNPFNKTLIAKFLTLPRLSKRAKHKRMLSETYMVMKQKADFLKMLSDKVGWDYTYDGNYCNFSGYRQFRHQYNQELESVLFSSGKINEFDSVEFKTWLNKLPALARERVIGRITVTDKYPKLKQYYIEWLKWKSDLQKQQRVLEEKVRQGTATVEEQSLLQQVKKDAKVNTGASNFSTLYNKICHNQLDELELESFVNKVNLPFNFLTIIDESGSMSGEPFNMAAFIASVLLVKNPDDTARNLIGMFANKARFLSSIDKKNTCQNSFWSRKNVVDIVPEPFVVPEKSFFENYQRISAYLNAIFASGGTHLNSIATRLKEIAEEEPDTIDALKQYPIWCIVSDGDINNSRTAKESILDFQTACKEYLGFIPFLIVFEVINSNNYDITHFAGIDQFMYIPGRPELLEQILTNFKDMEPMDAYSPLLSIWRSNRYAPVRANVL